MNIPSISIILMCVFTYCLFVSLMIIRVKGCLFYLGSGKSLNIVTLVLIGRTASLQHLCNCFIDTHIRRRFI